jgi:hypothetical protein
MWGTINNTATLSGGDDGSARALALTRPQGLEVSWQYPLRSLQVSS